MTVPFIPAGHRFLLHTKIPSVGISGKIQQTTLRNVRDGIPFAILKFLRT